MLEKTCEFLEKYKIQSENVIVAFSAGPDSTALALVLDKLKEKFNLKIFLAYFNHGWRKEEAENEEKFSENFARKINAVFLSAHAPKNVKKSEEIARNLRYEFLSDCAEKNNSKVVFLAHNKNDNAETLIYRLVKGTSVSGMTAIPENRGIYYRPFLNVEKKEILEFLKEEKQTFLKDSSNDNVKYKRNYIRSKILPLFEEINPNYLSSIDNLIKNAAATRRIVNVLLKNSKEKIFSGENMIRSEFLLAGRDIGLEILNELLAPYLKNRDYKTILRIYDFILKNENSKISINSNLFLKIKENEIFLEKKLSSGKISKCDEVLIEKEGEYIFLDSILKIEKSNALPSTFPSKDAFECYLSFDFPLVLRKRRPGDVFSPFGLGHGKMKLKKYFINEKIPQNIRDEFVLLAKENEICWIPGEKISENFKAKDLNCYKLNFKKRGENEKC